MAPHHSQRGSFDDAAAEYDAVRPGYPEALIEDVIALSSLPEEGRILEVGCGTGQATLPFARRGYCLTALDLGTNMVRLAREKLEPFPEVRVYQSAFEDFEAEAESFDLVMAATAWHWIDGRVGYAKAARLLEPTGSLAVFSNLHPKPYTSFFKMVQSLYDEVFGPTQWVPTEESIAATAEAISSSGHFPSVEVRTYPWAQTYTTKDYLRLLNTYSDHRSLEPERRARLFEAVAERLERDCGGVLERPYLSALFVASRP